MSTSVPRDTIPSLLSEALPGSGSALESLEAGPAALVDILRMAERLGGALRGCGVTREDRVAVVSPNGPAMVTAFLGASWAARCAPLNPAYGRAELDFYLDDLQPAAVLVASTLDTRVREAARARGITLLEIADQPNAVSGTITVDGDPLSPGSCDLPRPDEIALILHTSGTTSRPKMVPLTHGNAAASARHIAATLALGPTDRSLTIMPLFHIHGLMAGLLAPLSAGGAVIVPPGFLATEFAGWLGRFRPSWYTAVPTMHQAIVQRLRTDEGKALRAKAPLRFVRSSSAALTPTALSDIESVLGVPVIEAYGMTEAAHQMASNPLPPGQRKPGSVGLAAGPEIAIMDASGAVLPIGGTGEVVIRGPNVMTGYLANDAANSEAFSDGWLRTGDQGSLDAMGYLTLTGRLKEQINRAGEKVAPLEVDAVLAEHPAVAQAICFGMPHAVLGEDVAAAVVLKPGMDTSPRALREFLSERLAYFKVPRQIRIVDQLPVGATGKLQRRGLAERLGMIAEIPVIAGDATPPGTPVEEIVAAAWVDILHAPLPGIHENFFAIGGDSVLATRVVARLRQQLQVNLSLLAFYDTPTVAGIALALDDLLRSEAEGA